MLIKYSSTPTNLTCTLAAPPSRCCKFVDFDRSVISRLHRLCWSNATARDMLASTVGGAVWRWRVALRAQQAERLELAPPPQPPCS